MRLQPCSHSGRRSRRTEETDHQVKPALLQYHCSVAIFLYKGACVLRVCHIAIECVPFEVACNQCRTLLSRCLLDTAALSKADATIRDGVLRGLIAVEEHLLAELQKPISVTFLCLLACTCPTDNHPRGVCLQAKAGGGWANKVMTSKQQKLCNTLT